MGPALNSAIELIDLLPPVPLHTRRRSLPVPRIGRRPLPPQHGQTRALRRPRAVALIVTASARTRCRPLPRGAAQRDSRILRVVLVAFLGSRRRPFAYRIG